MRAFFGKTIPPLAAIGLASGALANVVTEHNDMYSLTYHSDSSGFGVPSASGNLIEYFPDGMVVSTGSATSGETETAKNWWSTSFTVVPNEGFDFTSLTFTERGEYGSDGADNSYQVEARMFISPLDNSEDWQFKEGWQFLRLEDTFESSGSGFWEVSGSVDLTDFAEGFVITIQNILTICSYPFDALQPVPALFSSEAMGYPGFELEGNFLSKRYIGIELQTTAVPLPASIGLFGSALGLVSLIARKKR